MKTSLSTSLFLSLIISLNAQKPGIRIDYIDSTYKPQNDFYKFCNGKWLEKTKIPDNEVRWGSFNEVNEQNLKNIKTILLEVSKNTNAPKGSNTQKLRDFYNTAMDSIKANKLGASPILPYLKEIDKIKNKPELFKLLAQFSKMRISNFLYLDVDVDLKNSKKYALYLAQSGFHLPDKEYYFSPSFAAIDSEYINHINRQLKNAGIKASKHQANKIFIIEKTLAKEAMNATELRDIEKQYNPISTKQLSTLYPKILWNEFFSELKITLPDTIIVTQPNYYKNLNTIIDSISINDWKLYLKWTLINSSAKYLSEKFETEAFNFWGKTLQGAKQKKPRWKYVQQTIDSYIGEILGQLYVERYFSQEAKTKINKLVDNLIAAYRERIDTRPWMSDATKKKAHEKLDKLIRKLGYPDKWKDYSELTITTNNYWENVVACSKFHVQDKFNKLYKPVDRYEWLMSPTTVNAYYNPTTNEITFPAAIMQPPFFDPQADDAANYGGIGAVIGHELTHGFDDQGAQFDADGNMNMWWTEEDYKKFQEKTKLIIEQFNQYIAIDTIHVNGQLTAGENIADLGGVTMAYLAYKKSLNNQPSPIINGFSGEQRFFIAWAQVWKTLVRDAILKQMLVTDPHSPGFIRAFAPLTNLKEFYDAFNVKDGDKMYRSPEKRVEIW